MALRFDAGDWAEIDAGEHFAAETVKRAERGTQPAADEVAAPVDTSYFAAQSIRSVMLDGMIVGMSGWSE